MSVYVHILLGSYAVYAETSENDMHKYSSSKALVKEDIVAKTMFKTSNYVHLVLIRLLYYSQPYINEYNTL